MAACDVIPRPSVSPSCPPSRPDDAPGTTVVVLQPSYLPWLGFFDQIRRSSVFVYYDDVQFDKNGWRNRNRIRNGDAPLWLTVPVRQNGRFGQAILETEIDRSQPWALRHTRSLRQCYARAPFLNLYMDELEELLHRPWSLLCDLDMAAVALICRWLELEQPLHRASELGIQGGQTERLLSICRHFGASRYLSGAAATCYLDVELMESHGVAVEFQDYRHPVYPQRGGPFLPYLSIIDLLFNMGPGSLEILASAVGCVSPDERPEGRLDESECLSR
jgi:hypothetical protein